MEGKTALPLQLLIASLDKNSLPKILQVASGVYFQGSIYELCGSEVCFSTGDLIKVTGIELHSVSCEDVTNSDTFELPLNHTGLFNVVPDKEPYNTLREMLTMRPVGLESSLPFTFTCRTKMTIDKFTLGPGRVLTVLSMEHSEGKEDQVRCLVQGQQETSVEVCIPVSARGEFLERESEERFTLQEIMSSACLKSRRFRFSNATKSQQPLVFSPIYQVHAVMNLRKSTVKFPSSLEMEVTDVTEQFEDVSFLTPLSLTEVLSQPEESFPMVVEILEDPVAHSVLKCHWLKELRKSKKLIFHKKGTSAMVLLSSQKSRKAQQYFLVSHQYSGRFRRRPREFNSVYELVVASSQVPGLTVSVTRNCEEVEEEGLPALGVGEQLKVVRSTRMELPVGNGHGQKQSVEALLCQRLQEPDDGDEDDDDDEEEDKVRQDDNPEEISLPVYMQGHFVEVLADSKRYRLRDLIKEFSFPLDVKVVSRDSELEIDPLFGLTCLRIEGTMLEPTILMSFLHKPEDCFEIPVQWLSLSICLTKDPVPWSGDPPLKCHVERVTEVTDAVFYEFRKRQSLDIAPPPRPPKRKSSAEPLKTPPKPQRKPSKTIKSQHKGGSDSAPTKELANLTLTCKRRPPAPPPPVTADDEPPALAPRKKSVAEMTSGSARPNTYVSMEESTRTAPVSLKGEAGNAGSDDDNDDYETIDESLITMMKTARENAMFY